MADDLESLDPGAPFLAHMLAGALAGTTEHCAMYPIDTLKTRMQAAECLTTVETAAAAATGRLKSPLFDQAIRSATAGASNPAPSGPSCNVCAPSPAAPRPSPSTATVLRTALRTEGVRGLYKGFGAAIAGAGPAHALHFAAYEYVRTLTTPAEATSLQLAVATGSAAAVATVFNDAVMTPADLIKQRMQVASTPHRSSLECLAAVVRTEGVATLFRGYQTALFMNVPFTAIHFAAYETSKVALGPLGLAQEGHSNHLVAGALAGGMAAALTTPFDVVKTRLQTEGLLQTATATAAAPTAARPITERSSGAASTSTSPSHAMPPRPRGPAAGPRAAPPPPDFALSHARASGSAAGSHSFSTTAAAAPAAAAPCGKAQARLSVAPVTALRQIAAREGWRTLLKGMAPRVLFHMPSAAICWATYEAFKEYFLPMFGGGGAGPGGEGGGRGHVSET